MVEAVSCSSLSRISGWSSRSSFAPSCRIDSRSLACAFPVGAQRAICSEGLRSSSRASSAATTVVLPVPGPPVMTVKALERAAQTAAENLPGDDGFRAVVALQIEPAVGVEQKRRLHISGGAAEHGGEPGRFERVDPRVESGQPDGFAGESGEGFARPLPEQAAAVAVADRPAGERGGEKELRGGIGAAEPEHGGGEFEVDRLEFAGGGQLRNECV